jgi:putative protease
MLSELQQGAPEPESDKSHALPRLSALCRDSAHIEAALKCGVTEILLDFEDVRRYRAAVDEIRNAVTQGAASNSPGAVSIWLATPRIQKAGEQGFFRLLENSEPDGVLVRNLGAIDFFKGSSNRRALRLRGDFSLNISNPLSAAEFLRTGMESLTLSYDLTADQVIELMESLPHAIRNRMELTLHQHMPMFHMEHCVFAAFLSKGSSYLDCGRPCEKHRVHLRDRTGVEHPLRADVGCRNTLFNAAAQTGAHFYERLYAAGLRRFRVELLEENREQSERILRAYQGLITRERNGADLWKHLRAKSQLGVTAGTLATKSNLELGAPPAWSAR